MQDPIKNPTHCLIVEAGQNFVEGMVHLGCITFEETAAAAQE